MSDLVHVETGELVERVRPQSPQQAVLEATQQANVLAQVIEAGHLYVNLKGKKYVVVEAWTTAAALRGTVPREVSNDADETGRYVAVVELVRLSDGAIVGRASAECGGPGDPTWQSRPAPVRRSMANTRATSKVCRQAFSWVISLAGYEATPAEEADYIPKKREPVSPPRSMNEMKEAEALLNEMDRENGDSVKSKVEELANKYADAVEVEDVAIPKAVALKGMAGRKLTDLSDTSLIKYVDYLAGEYNLAGGKDGQYKESNRKKAIEDITFLVTRQDLFENMSDLLVKRIAAANKKVMAMKEAGVW